MAGTWMQQIAMGWLIYKLTDSALVLGLLGFASQVPVLLFSALGGVWSDRMDRRRLMMATQTLALLQALTLALLTWQGWITPTLLLSMAFSWAASTPWTCRCGNPWWCIWWRTGRNWPTPSR